MPVKAYILITTAAKETRGTLTKLRASSIVQSAETISGPYDVIAIVQAESIDLLGQLITQEIHSIDGVEHTSACIVMNL